MQILDLKLIQIFAPLADHMALKILRQKLLIRVYPCHGLRQPTRSVPEKFDTIAARGSHCLATEPALLLASIHSHDRRGEAAVEGFEAFNIGVHRAIPGIVLTHVLDQII